MVAAAVAAGVAVSAVAASTALQASQSGGPDLPSYGGASGMEARLSRDQFNALRSQRSYTERGAYEGNLLQPSLYEFAGFTPEYDPASFDAANAARGRASQSQRDFDAARAKVDSLTGANRKAALAGLKGKARQRALKQIKASTRDAKRQLKVSKKGLDTGLQTASNAEADAGRITGLKAGRLGTKGEQEFEDILHQRALDAARTGSSSDPRLNRELAQQEGDIRARLSRQFGPDYANSTGGRAALNAFEQRKAESLTDFSRKDLELEGAAVAHENSLAGLAANRINLALTGPNARGAQAASFGDLSSRYMDFEKYLQADRLGSYEAKSRQAQSDYEAGARRTQIISSGLNNLASAAGSYGLSSYGGAAGGGKTMAGAASYTPSTVPDRYSLNR